MSTTHSSIQVLPQEVLGHIIEWTANPVNPHQMLHLLQVSTSWREVTLSHSRLFTRADWDSWSPELIALWCSRARNQLLSIELHEQSLASLSHGLDPSNFSNHPRSPEYCHTLVAALFAAIPNAEVLEIHSERREEIVAIASVLAMTLPNLRMLKIKRYEDWEERITLDCPNLSKLSVTAIKLDFRNPLTHLSVFRHKYLYGGDESSWQELSGTVLTSTQQLQELSIGTYSAVTITEPVLHLPSLRKLTLHHQEDSDFNSALIFKSMLENLHIPLLEELRFTYGFNNTNRDGFDSFFRALPKSITHLRLGPGLMLDAVAFPLMIIRLLLSGHGPPKLEYLDCHPTIGWMLAPEENQAIAQPERADFESALVLLAAQRTVARLRVPIISRGCRQTLRDQYGIDIEVC
ncbi:hypothetical protein DL93DRAFT_1865486 [Clavulina sp. PMI_390]|nr:hypothetical protein DL93DRAFT_1865486 [Clavulina sp. PMI_390]